MSYLVLARKWRPRSFSTLVGQDHVVRALSNALQTQRIHHAWLFTGTRGVGKTTLARILAKCLNCEQGISAEPCGVCSACTEIDQGRFVDYIEVDAASNRSVDEITPLLEQAIYAPTRGRFKIYTIDEVHMLSTHAFNAMLKTLEEPPPHLKFILATTDPQKIPVTVLSRCIQYNLKRMSTDNVVHYLQHILDQEQVGYDEAGLRLLAHAAAGSMRDALSLTDQAIAFSGNHISTQAMQDMLGAIDPTFLVRLIDSLAKGEAQQVVALADALAERSYSFEGALADLASLLSKIAIEQKIPGTIGSDEPLQPELQALAQTLSPDLLQLFYAIAINGRSELVNAPDEYAGFVMVCLRMLSLTEAPQVQAEMHRPPAVTAPTTVTNTTPTEDLKNTPAPKNTATSPTNTRSPQAQNTPAASAATVTAAPKAPAAPQAASSAPVSQDNRGTSANSAAKKHQPSADSSPKTVTSRQSSQRAAQSPSTSSDEPPFEPDPEPDSASTTNLDRATPVKSTQAPRTKVAADHRQASASEPVAPSETTPAPQKVSSSSPEPSEYDLADYPELDASYDKQEGFEGAQEEDRTWQPTQESHQLIALEALDPNTWIQVVQNIHATGLAGEILRQSEWLKTEGNTIYLKNAVANVQDFKAKDTISTLLTEYFSKIVKVNFVYQKTGDATLYAQEQQQIEQRQQQAWLEIQSNDFIQSLLKDFDGKIDKESLQLGH
ncbi:DNA polymerase III subunit gamma/tau [Brackiella oedipodis]|uniref:DNA polymerase III subunit gamma/tau n=1 Tax=Brackiella oedipodis TaxID=124225 RepID=UPI00048BABAA|nr:DNA polymerase III subunit gamma/tau [Brackiella oedipodis]